MEPYHVATVLAWPAKGKHAPILVHCFTGWSILFATEMKQVMHHSLTAGSTISTVPYLQIQDIDFTSPEKQMKMSKPADIAVSVRLNLANHHFFTPIIVL